MNKPYPIAGETPARLVLRNEGTRTEVLFDGVHVATMEGWSGLKRGWSTVLEDGSVLEVRTIRRTLFPELSILRNGVHVASSPSHPHKILRSYSNTLLFLSAFLIVMGVTGTWGRIWLDAVFGVCYLIAALLLRARYRLGAAVSAVPLFIRLDLILIAAFTGQLYPGWMRDVAFDLIFLIFVVRCYMAANDSRMLARA